MGRSRPKLSQSPWSGLDAVRKIMDRFGEFGESLNRMAGALHGLEDSMKHLLGVTSRVTAAMLMLHGSLAYTGKPQGNKNSSGTDADGNKIDFDALRETNRTRKKEQTEADNAQSKAYWDRINKDIAYNNRLKKLNNERIKLEERANKYKTAIEDGLFYSKREQRRNFAKDRADALSKLSIRRANPNFVNDEETKKPYLETKTKQEKAEKDAKTPVPGTSTPTGPSDTVIKKWVLDTEYAFKSMELDPVKAQKNQSSLDPKDQKANRIITQISLVGVNELGQAIKTFTQDIKPALGTGENLYNLGNTTQDKHDEWLKNENKKTNRVSLDDAALALKAFADKEKVTDAIVNKDPTAPKLVGKNVINADFAAANNAINKPLGDALSLSQMPDENKLPAVIDPMTSAATSIKRLLKGFKAEELESVAKNFNLNRDALNNLVNPANAGGFKQEELMNLFGQTYPGAGAHDATSDATAYGRLEVLISELSRVLLTTIDNRSDNEALADAGLGDEDLKNLDSTTTAKYNNSLDVADMTAMITNAEAKIKALDVEASNLALTQTAQTSTASPAGPKAYLSSFSMNSDKSWKEQPHLLVDGKDVLSPNTNPNATPEDYITKLKELKAANATSTMGSNTDFNEAIDAFSNASKITPLDPNMTYAGFKPNPNPSTTSSNPHASRVHVTPFETTGTGAFATKPKMDIDRLPAMTGTYADDTAYTEEMISKLDELIAADATNMQGSSDELKAIRDILKNVLDEFKNYKDVPAPIPPGVPILSKPVTGGPTLPPPPPVPSPASLSFFPKSLKDVGAQVKAFGQNILKVGTHLNTKLKEIDFSKVIGGQSGALKEAFGSLAKGLFVAATAASGAVMGLSQLSSPDVFATFQNSLVLLGMNIGSAFMTPMLKLSWYIQQLAGQFENMSPAVRETLESLAYWSISIVGASLALKAFAFIISPIVMATKALWSLVVAIGATIAAMGKNGIVNTVGNGIAGLMGGDAVINTGKFALVVGRVAGVVGLVSAAFLELRDQIYGTRDGLSRRLIDSIEASHNKKVEEVIDRSNVKATSQEESEKADKNYADNKIHAENVLVQSKETSDLFAKQIKEKSYGVEVGGPGTKSEVLDKTSHPLHDLMGYESVQSNVHADEKLQAIKEYSQYEQMYHKDKEAGNEKGANINLGRMATILSNVYKIAETRSEERKQSITASAMYKDAPPSQYINQLREFGIGQGQLPGGFNEKKVTKRTAAETKKDAQDSFDKGGGMKGLLMSLQSFRSQPSYMGVEEAHRRVQVEALKSDPLEQKINEIRSNELRRMVESLAKIEAGNSKKSTILEYSEFILGAGHK